MAEKGRGQGGSEEDMKQGDGRLANKTPSLDATRTRGNKNSPDRGQGPRPVARPPPVPERGPPLAAPR
ncbi:hypothetical protein THAOC_27388, partial [Thalassiosira oceanica]